MIAPGSQRRSEVHQPGAAPVVRARLGDAIAARRSLPIGAECRPDGVEFVVWAPARRKVELVLEGPSDSLSMASGGRGYFVLLTSRARPGARYWFLVDGEGTLAAAEPELPRLAALGVTLIELMPVADFAGSFGWGYDGVDLYAPSRLYGRPDDLRRFIDAAHALGLGVMLDVVYNHLGPEGNHLRQFSPDYFTDRYQNEWGDAINFDGESSAGVREFFVSNAGYWIDEFHFDGLRLDATQQIFDSSPEHVLAAIGERVREAAAGRATLLVAENEAQHARLARPLDRGGY